ncbi:MAG: DNA repair protein RecN [Cyanobacteria bacterium SBLK]|nr:DNA repair protein RecN [Cyanobacteria bacterium SBLK]
MLLSLRIENFALVDRLELEFGRGLNVLTGETGAGKSIILDAIDATLGGKISSRFIRTGSQKAMVEGTFLLNNAIAQWLSEQEIEPIEEGCVICSRELAVTAKNFRSRSRINGVLVNRTVIAQLRDRLVEITAQGQTVQLFNPNHQRELLDAYGGETLLPARSLVAKQYEAAKTAKDALEQRQKSEQERLQRLDWLKFQMQDLEAAELGDREELDNLKQERDRLSHVVDLQNLSYETYQLLYQSDSEDAIADRLAKTESLLEEMLDYDGQLESILDMVRSAIAQVVEAGQQLSSYGDSLESDPHRLEEVEERIRTLKQICRKYGPDLKDAIAYYENLQAELYQLSDRGQSLENLEQNYRERQQELVAACETLTQYRQTTARELARELIGELKPLAMDKVRFECRVTSITPTVTGSDRVEFYFSPNPGEPLHPLSETASGGEMSRFLLALKACFSPAETHAKSQKTLIFDEIDAGVSGKVAEAIAEKLHHLSTPHQILCVTHQPLIAALADRHFRVDKRVEKAKTKPLSSEKNGKDKVKLSISGNEPRTLVRVTRLEDRDSRRDELAQLAGGHSAREASAFAESLLDRGANRRRFDSE